MHKVFNSWCGRVLITQNGTPQRTTLGGHTELQPCLNSFLGNIVLLNKRMKTQKGNLLCSCFASPYLEMRCLELQQLWCKHETVEKSKSRPLMIPVTS